jgi:hypothetical protein
MPFPAVLANAVGSWSGVSRLNLTHLPPEERVSEWPTTATVRSVNDEYLVLDYTWTYEGKDERGTMLIASSQARDETTIGWTDSWHQNTAVMLLTGSGASRADCYGVFHVEGHPDWGWRIAVSLERDTLVVRMFISTPEGEEDWAVEKVYERA